MNAVVYARFSCHKQGEQSIEGQLAAAYQYAVSHGYTIIHEYIDRAMTGRNDDREQFQQMLCDTAKHQFEAIIIWKIDRFGRNREEIAFNKYRCKKNGVKVLYTAESIPDTPEGIILEAVLEGMAEYYSVQLSTNVKRGMSVAASKGHSTGGRLPLGYRTGPDKRLEIDPETAPIVQKIFDLYASGYSQKEIVDQLNAEGVRNRKGEPLGFNSLRALLKNKKYIGIYHYDGEEYPDAYIPPLITPEVFAKVQNMLALNKRAPSRRWSKTDYILAGKLYCGLCGQSMVGESGTNKVGTKYLYYNCIGKRKYKTCKKKTVRKEWIEKIVLDQTRLIVINDSLIEEIVESTFQYYSSEHQESSYVNTLRAELKKVEASISNLIKAVEAGLFSAATKERMDELEQQRASLETAIAETELVCSFRLTKEAIRYFLLQFRNYDFEDRECQKRIVDTFINAVYVYEERITITYNYSGDQRIVSLEELKSDATVCAIEELGHHSEMTFGCQAAAQGAPASTAKVFLRLNLQSLRWIASLFLIKPSLTCSVAPSLQNANISLVCILVFLPTLENSRTPCLFVHFTKGRVSVLMSE